MRVEIQGFGPVTFPPLGTLELKRVQERARRGPVPGERPEQTKALRAMPARKAQRARENALLLSYVTDPKLTDDELAEAFAGRKYLIEEIAQAIRDASR